MTGSMPATPAPTRNGQQALAAFCNKRRLGEGERHTPDTPHGGRRRPPLGALVPPAHPAKTPHKSMGGGVGDGS